MQWKASNAQGSGFEIPPGLTTAARLQDSVARLSWKHCAMRMRRQQQWPDSEHVTVLQAARAGGWWVCTKSSLLHKPGHLGSWPRQGEVFHGAVSTSRHPWRHLRCTAPESWGHFKDQPQVNTRMQICPVLRDLTRVQPSSECRAWEAMAWGGRAESRHLPTEPTGILTQTTSQSPQRREFHYLFLLSSWELFFKSPGLPLGSHVSVRKAALCLQAPTGMWRRSNQVAAVEVPELPWL